MPEVTLIPIFERLHKRLLVTTNGCWEWQGFRLRGYGMIGRGRRGEGTALTHRVAWEEAYGPIPDGLCVLHSCDNPPCCNVEHLFLGTQTENLADMDAKGRRADLTGRFVGEKNPSAKLTVAQVVAIRADTRPQVAIAAKYGMSKASISEIKSGKKWREVPLC